MVVSNVPGKGDSAVSSLEIEGAIIVAKETAHDSRSLAKYAHDTFAAGNYDFMVVMADNPTAAEMALRKYDGITSAVCSDANDAASAREDGANAVVVKADDAERAVEVISTLAKGRGFARQLKARIPGIQKPSHEEGEGRQQEEHAKPAAVTKQHVAQAPEPDEPDLPRRPGVGGWIKDALGIVDVEKPKKEAREKDSREKHHQAGT